MDYIFWRIWGETYEGNRVWFMVRTRSEWTKFMVQERAEENCRGGGVGGDIANILEVEEGSETSAYEHYE